MGNTFGSDLHCEFFFALVVVEDAFRPPFASPQKKGWKNGAEARGWKYPLL